MKCIADLDRSPLRKKLDASHIPVRVFAGDALSFYNAPSTRDLLEDIVSFYLLNELVDEVAKTSRYAQCQDLLEPYFELSLALALDMARYLQVTTTREARYQRDKELPSKFEEDHIPYAMVLGNIMSCGSSEALTSVMTRVNGDDWAMGAYTRTMVDWYMKGTYGTAYGGKAWGAIAKLLKQFVHGEIPAETFVDQCWSLQHNTSSVFNKNLIFNTHWLPQIGKLLDMQAAGQLGAWFCTADDMEKESQSKMVGAAGDSLCLGVKKFSKKADKWHELARKYKPSLFDGIDFKAVVSVDAKSLNLGKMKQTYNDAKFFQVDTNAKDPMATAIPMIQVHPKLALKEIKRT